MPRTASPRSSCLIALVLALAVAGCSDKTPAPESMVVEPQPLPAEATPPADGPVPLPTEGGEQAPPTEAAAPATDAAAFDPASVPESSASLPPFPFFKAPEGLTSTYDDKDRNKRFDREHMIAGGKVIAVEGKVFHDRFRLNDPDQREYSEIEFHRNYADAIGELGGVEVSRAQYTAELLQAFGGRDAVDRHYTGTCASDGCENHTYLIRQAGKEYWIQVSTGAVPPHGEVVVVERQGMASKLGFLDAGAMQKAIAANGKVALHINFDVDKATLRPDAQPVIAEIRKLLVNVPTLKLSIEGHTDDTGTAAHNQQLSAERAASVRTALVALGIDPERLSSKGYGQDKPVADNATDPGRAENRRVELVKID